MTKQWERDHHNCIRSVWIKPLLKYIGHNWEMRSDIGGNSEFFLCRRKDGCWTYKQQCQPCHSKDPFSWEKNMRYILKLRMDIISGKVSVPFWVRAINIPQDTGVLWNTIWTVPVEKAAAAWCWRDCEEIPHVQRQRSPSKKVGTGVAAAHHWRGFEEIPHVQGKRRSPSKTVGGAKLHLESNPIPARDAQRAQTNPVNTRTQEPHRDCNRTVLEHLLWRYGSAVDCRRGRGSGCSRLGCGISPLGGGCQ